MLLQASEATVKCITMVISKRAFVVITPLVTSLCAMHHKKITSVGAAVTLGLLLTPTPTDQPAVKTA